MLLGTSFLCSTDLVSQGRGMPWDMGTERAQRAKPLPCLRGQARHSFCRRGRRPRSYRLAGSSHSFALRWKDRLSHVCQKPKSRLGLCWGRQQGGVVYGERPFSPEAWASPGLCLCRCLRWEGPFPQGAARLRTPGGRRWPPLCCQAASPRSREVTLSVSSRRGISYCLHKKESCSLYTLQKRKCLNCMGIKLV